MWIGDCSRVYRVRTRESGGTETCTTWETDLTLKSGSPRLSEVNRRTVKVTGGPR